MKRRTLLSGAAAALAAAPLARPHAQKKATIRWWYHFDDPKATPDELVAAFEKEHPDIKVEPENIPWGAVATTTTGYTPRSSPATAPTPRW